MYASVAAFAWGVDAMTLSASFPYGQSGTYDERRLLFDMQNISTMGSIEGQSPRVRVGHVNGKSPSRRNVTFTLDPRTRTASVNGQPVNSESENRWPIFGDLFAIFCDVFLPI